MYRYKRFIHLSAFLIILILTFNLNYNPFILNDSATVSVPITETAKKSDPLYQELVSKEGNYNEPAQDAKIDQVWKKVPGRNGLKVNIQKSYENMKKEGQFNESLLSFDQIVPDITLEDLPASPIYKGHPEKDMVALMINVSWGTEHVPTILTVLKKHQVKATFFIEGKWAKENAELVKMIDEQGHLIGNHAYNHPDMAQLSLDKNREQIVQTNDIINAIIGKEPLFFAPPSGSFTAEVVGIAHQLKMATILWTVDTIDWKNPSVSVMLARVLDNIHPGAMILMHPTLPVAKGLDTMIIEIKNKGYRLGTVKNLLSEER